MANRAINASFWIGIVLLATGAVLITGRVVSGGSAGGVVPLPTCLVPTAITGGDCATPCLLGGDQVLCDLTPSPTVPEVTSTPDETSTPTPTTTGETTSTPSVTPTAGDATTTATETSTATETPTPTETETPTETLTPTPTDTPTAAPTPTATPVPVLGDVDCNDRVSTVDAALILQYVAGFLRSLGCPLNGDINGDTRADSIDASFILQYTASLIQELPPVRTYVGTVIVVRGREAECLALSTGGQRLVFWDPTGLTPGERVRVLGFMDPFAAFCGFTPLLHNISVEQLD